jgi:hypothetical protein
VLARKVSEAGRLLGCIGLQTSRAAFGDSERVVCGGGGDADAGAELEVRAIRKREDASGRDDGVFLGGAARRATVAGGRQRNSARLQDFPATDALSLPAAPSFDRP